jgi:hypothetical protein
MTRNRLQYMHQQQEQRRRLLTGSGSSGSAGPSMDGAPPGGMDHDHGLLFRGLTPPPWPTDLTPHSKRPRDVQEVIEDDSPRAKDKLSEEIEELEQAIAAVAAAAAAKKNEDGDGEKGEEEEEGASPSRSNNHKRIRLASHPKKRRKSGVADTGSQGGSSSAAPTKHRGSD